MTDRKHGGVQLDDFQRQLLILLDGTLDHSQLRTRMAQRVEQGTLLLHSDGQRITTADAATPVIDRVLAPCLDSLAKLGPARRVMKRNSANWSSQPDST